MTIELYFYETDYTDKHNATYYRLDTSRSDRLDYKEFKKRFVSDGGNYYAHESKFRNFQKSKRYNVTLLEEETQECIWCGNIGMQLNREQLCEDCRY